MPWPNLFFVNSNICIRPNECFVAPPPKKKNQSSFFRLIAGTKTSVVVNKTFEILLKFIVSGSNAIDKLPACTSYYYAISHPACN